MYKVKKNDKALVELKALAESSNMDVKSLLLSVAHLDKVCEIFYAQMPKLVRMAMNKEKFKVFYSQHKEEFANSIQV